jgi:flavin-dependent dehydrogenase
MGANRYDAIVVGARCAGSPAAMLLARKGHKVLLVDRATFPSDTISTHLIHTPGVAALRRWGLLDRVIATGCPPIDTYHFDVGPFVISGTPGDADSPVSYAPRRTVLDKLLVDAAAEAGADVREAFTVDEILMHDGQVTGIRGHAKGGGAVSEHARLVLGADGIHSVVAHAVNAEEYNQRSELEAGYYSYWSGLPVAGGFEAYDRGNRGWAAWRTNADLTLVVVGWPIAEFQTIKRDPERCYLETFDRAPAFAERIRAARREERVLGMTVRSFFRKPFGPGWALAGDAGYNRDFITAQGMSDAFHDAELAANAVDEWLSGRQAFDAAMAAYHTTRDQRVMAMFEFTCQFARLEPAPPEMQQLMAAIHGNEAAMNGFVRVYSGALSPAAFFSPANVGAIVAAAAARQNATVA